MIIIPNLRIRQFSPSTETLRLDENNNKIILGVKDDPVGFSHVVCSCSVFSRKGWCKHTLGTYSDLDIQKLFTPAQAITIFSQNPTLIINVLCRPSEDFADMDEVRVVLNAQRESGNTFSYNDGFVIGFLNMADKSCHRKVIRTMILEWLPAIPDMYPDLMQCQSTAHIKGSSRLEQELPTTLSVEAMKYVYTDSFCLLEYRKCYSCLRDLLPPDQD